jgi:putative transposase
VVLDLYSRAVVGWAMDKQITAVGYGCLGHGLMVTRCCGRLNTAQGLGAVSTPRATISGCCDSLASIVPCHAPATANAFAVMESFFGTLKQELVQHERYATRQAAKASIFEYIEVFYNPQ